MDLKRIQCLEQEIIRLSALDPMVHSYPKRIAQLKQRLIDLKNQERLIMRYSLKTNPAWCLNWKNGWIRFNDYMIRWNTTWYPTGEHEIFLISKLKQRKP